MELLVAMVVLALVASGFATLALRTRAGSVRLLARDQAVACAEGALEMIRAGTLTLSTASDGLSACDQLPDWQGSDLPLRVTVQQNEPQPGLVQVTAAVYPLGSNSDDPLGEQEQSLYQLTTVLYPQ